MFDRIQLFYNWSLEFWSWLKIDPRLWECDLAIITSGSSYILLFTSNLEVRRSDVNILARSERKMISRKRKRLTLSWRGSLSYRNQSIDLQSKSMDWLLYERDLRHGRVNITKTFKLWASIGLINISKILAPSNDGLRLSAITLLNLKEFLLFLRICQIFWANLCSL